MWLRRLSHLQRRDYYLFCSSTRCQAPRTRPRKRIESRLRAAIIVVVAADLDHFYRLDQAREHGRSGHSWRVRLLAPTFMCIAARLPGCTPRTARETAPDLGTCDTKSRNPPAPIAPPGSARWRTFRSSACAGTPVLPAVPIEASEASSPSRFLPVAPQSASVPRVIPLKPSSVLPFTAVLGRHSRRSVDSQKIF